MALTVTIIQARDLPSADRNGKSDPFVVLTLNGVTHKTKVIKSTLTPYWGESFTFIPASFNASLDTLKLEVFDWDRFTKNDLLTTNLLPLAKFAANGTTEEWIALNAPKGGSKGSLQLRVVYGDGKPQPSTPAAQASPQATTPQAPHPGTGFAQPPLSGGFNQQAGASWPHPSPPGSAGHSPSPPGSYGAPQQNYGQFQHQAPASGGFAPVPGGQPGVWQPQHQYQQAPGSGGFAQPPTSGGFAPMGQQAMWQPQPGFQPQQGYGAPPHSGGFSGQPQQYAGLQPPSYGAQPVQQGLAPPRWTGPNYGLPPAEIVEAENAFLRYDTDFSGTIDRNELKPLLRAVFGSRMSEGLMDRYASMHFQMADTDRSGQIDFGEFLSLYAKLKQLAGRPL